MDQATKDELTHEHMALVERIVAAERNKLGANVEIDDLRSFAFEGFSDALNRYDPSRKVPFPAYAAPRIRGSIYDGLSQMDWFPRKLRRRITYYRKCEESLNQYTETPPPEDKVEAVHQLADRLKELAAAYITTYAAETEKEVAAEPAKAELALERKRFCSKLKVHIDALPEKQRHIIKSYYFNEKNLVEIAREMEISKSWASKLLSAGLRNLRLAFDGKPLFMDDPGFHF
ncbi:MAG: sigma-70 family RNA polymerase sigma factor [Proteobacteria bacterium]|nr:sigma-70 family RNA polymerase sigma factor [Pseudomonadota bacterium]